MCRKGLDYYVETLYISSMEQFYKDVLEVIRKTREL